MFLLETIDRTERSPVSDGRRSGSELKILYIVYWGAMEPLGQALVVPPMLRLAAAGVRLTLVTFEKSHHLDCPETRARCADRLREAGVVWIPRRYHAGLWATALDIAQALVAGMRAAGSAPDLVVGRTYVGGVMGLLVSKLLRRPFVFHNEGFWPDEMIDGGTWPAGCWRYRVAKRIELGLYRQAAGVITLSTQARRLVIEFREKVAPTTTIVVPSCVDLDAFRPVVAQVERGGTVSLVYIGSLGVRYRIGEMARFFLAVRKVMPLAILTIYSHSSADMIRARLREHGVPDDAWKLDFVLHQEMGEVLRRHTAGLFFLTSGVSTQVCSPTKIGEYWASGLPVVTTPGVGDVEAAVRAEHVGVVIAQDTEEACLEGARQLCALLQDPDLAARCRRAAKRMYDLQRGIDAQLELFEEVVTANRAGRRYPQRKPRTQARPIGLLS